MNAGCRVLYFYTMNLEAPAIKILKGLEILDKRKKFPWIKGSSAQRKDEMLRPIFWANKS